MQHFRDLQLVRTVEIRKNDAWIKMSFVSLKYGDIFRLTESRVGEKDNTPMPGIWRALSDAKHFTNQGLPTIAIDCEEVIDDSDRLSVSNDLADID